MGIILYVEEVDIKEQVKDLNTQINTLYKEIGEKIEDKEIEYFAHLTDRKSTEYMAAETKKVFILWNLEKNQLESQILISEPDFYIIKCVILR